MKPRSIKRPLPREYTIEEEDFRISIMKQLCKRNTEMMLNRIECCYATQKANTSSQLSVTRYKINQLAKEILKKAQTAKTEEEERILYQWLAYLSAMVTNMRDAKMWNEYDSFVEFEYPAELLSKIHYGPY